MKPFTEIIMLGSGEAIVTRCYNTCFILRTDRSTILVDGGGGNGILCQLEKAQIPLTEISSIFLTHSHSDHIMGVVWVLRMLGEYANSDVVQSRKIHIVSNRETLESLIFICRCTLSSRVLNRLMSLVEYIEVADGQTVDIVPDLRFNVFDTGTLDTMQTGFQTMLPNGETLVCLGDAQCTENIAKSFRGVDWMLCEAFCLDKDKDRFHPHKFHHNTVIESARIASRMKVKNLVLYHTEDTDLDNRKQSYTKEAATYFNGSIYVPDDLEKILIY